MLGVGQVVVAVGEVCGGSRRGVSWGDAARSNWSRMTRLGNFPYFLNLKIRIIKEQDEVNKLDQGEIKRIVEDRSV